MTEPQSDPPTRGWRHAFAAPAHPVLTDAETDALARTADGIRRAGYGPVARTLFGAHRPLGFVLAHVVHLAQPMAHLLGPGIAERLDLWGRVAASDAGAAFVVARLDESEVQP